MNNFAIAKFLDGEKVKIWPSNKTSKLKILEYLSSKFVKGKTYSEKQVNHILQKYSLILDPATLRRELYDNYFLDREADGSKYWKTKK